MKKHFIPKADAERALWLRNFAAKLPLYAARYNLSLAQIEDLKASSEFFSFCLDYRNQYEQYLKKLVQYKRDIADADVNLTLGELPVPPTFTAAPSFVPPGIFKRAATMAATIKNALQYTVADGNDLGLEGVEAHTDIANIKPDISARITSAGYPEIVWQKQRMQALEIHKENENGQFQFLDIDISPNYTDPTPLPPAGQGKVCRYKAIYRYDDVQAGQWSDIISIIVSGS